MFNASRTVHMQWTDETTKSIIRSNFENSAFGFRARRVIEILDCYTVFLVLGEIQNVW